MQLKPTFQRKVININIECNWIETFIAESKKKELEIRRKIDEQKNNHENNYS